MVSFRQHRLRSTWAKAGEIRSACSLWWVFLQKRGNKVMMYKMFLISVIALVKVSCKANVLPLRQGISSVELLHVKNSVLNKIRESVPTVR